MLRPVRRASVQFLLGAITFGVALAATPVVLAAQAATPAPVLGSLNGTVLDDVSNRPIANAEIIFVGLGLKARSDSAGNFSVAAIPAGLHTITIGAEGYASLSTRLGFVVGQHIESDFGMRPSTPMRGIINLDGKSPPPTGGPLAGFEERRSAGVGRFITRDVFENASGRKLADIIKQRIPGIRIISNNGERSAATGSRGLQSFNGTPGAADTKKECYAQVLVDGIVLYSSRRGDRLFNLDNVDPTNVAGVEFYTVSQTPSQFNATGSAPCGTLLIWQQR